jgi:hypothetical protein
MLLLPMLVGLQLVAADPVPRLDVGPGCRATTDVAEMSEAGCLSDERKAREDLANEWAQFSANDKAMCTDETKEFNPSYVELLTCLETARDAKIPYTPGK